MEDLGNETLAQISTPMRARGASWSNACLNANPTESALAAQVEDEVGVSAAVEGSSGCGKAPGTVGIGGVACGNGSGDDLGGVDACAFSRIGGASVVASASGASAVADAADEDDGRRMFDKRELRKRNRCLFEQQLTTWREKNLNHTSPLISGVSEASRIRVCVRKRPLFEHEREADEMDVISVRGASELVIHNCLTKADLRALFVSHMGFQFSRVFGENAADHEVYTRCCEPAVRHVLDGGVATLFMFGQTGSGKTHTMSGLLQRAAAHLFEGSESSSTFGFERDGEERLATTQACGSMSLTAFEIAGKTMRDLLDQSGASQQKELKIMEDKGHRTCVLGATSKRLNSAEELLSLIHGAQACRATRATQVNDTSSRSHAVYQIHRDRGSGPPCVLTLVDCAGSERREDSTHHDVQSRKDAAEINSTIFALKECFRVMRSSKGQQPPYRESLLTRVLQDSFSSDRALIVAIGTVSPSATDTEHSLGTLRALQQLQGTSMAFESREDVVKKATSDPVHPRHWTEDEVKLWVEHAIGGRARQHAAALTKGTDGKNITRWPVQRFVMLCSGEEDVGLKLYQDLRQRQQGAGKGS